LFLAAISQILHQTGFFVTSYKICMRFFTFSFFPSKAIT
jgi:hypothetical protein